MVDARFFSRAALYVALAAALIGAVALPALAAPVLTIADGPVQVLCGPARFEAAEGVALADDDIVRTTDATRVARIEFADGRVLDLGPGTQALLLSDAAAASHGMAGAGAVIAQGWAKLAAAAGAPARVALPGIVVAAGAGGTVLMHAAADGTALAFAESRAASLFPRGAGRETGLREGESWTRDAQSPSGSIAARSALLREVPRALTDTLPRRAARFAGRTVEPAEGQPLDAADLAPWLRAEPALLAHLRPRMATLARNSLAPQGVKPVVAQATRSTSRRPAATTNTASAIARAKAARSRVEPVTASASSDEVLLVPGLAVPEPAAALFSSQALPPTALLTAEGVMAGLPAVARITPIKRY
jgi:hypothetical protein